MHYFEYIRGRLSNLICKISLQRIDRTLNQASQNQLQNGTLATIYIYIYILWNSSRSVRVSLNVSPEEHAVFALTSLTDSLFDIKTVDALLIWMEMQHRETYLQDQNACRNSAFDMGFG